MITAENENKFLGVAVLEGKDDVLGGGKKSTHSSLEPSFACFAYSPLFPGLLGLCPPFVKFRPPSTPPRGRPPRYHRDSGAANVSVGEKLGQVPILSIHICSPSPSSCSPPHTTFRVIEGEAVGVKKEEEGGVNGSMIFRCANNSFAGAAASLVCTCIGKGRGVVLAVMAPVSSSFRMHAKLRFRR